MIDKNLDFEYLLAFNMGIQEGLHGRDKFSRISYRRCLSNILAHVSFAFTSPLCKDATIAILPRLQFEASSGSI